VKRILLATPRGFCMGVARGLRMLDDAVAQAQGTVYVRGEIVHNTVLVKQYKARGVVFVKEIDAVPEGGLVVFSTHGVAPRVRENAAKKGLTIVDATCPLVAKVHDEAVRFRDAGYSIVLIGDARHPEIIGVVGEAPEHIHVIRDERDFDKLAGIDESRVAWLSQTTLNVDDTQQIMEKLREKFPLLQDPAQASICYATTERQRAVRQIAPECDLFIVVGSAQSNNANKLVEVALQAGARRAVRVDAPEELDGVDFSDINTVGVTAGASVAEAQVESVVDYLEKKAGFYA